MDHSHVHHGDGSMGATAMDRCSMNMLFTWDTKNLCIIFRWWHIRSTSDLVVSLALVVFITTGYEALREFCRRYDEWCRKKLEAAPPPDGADAERIPILWSGRGQARIRSHSKAALYAIQNFYAFMLMLLFMTYNGWVMLAMTVGWFMGHMVFGGTLPLTKETACH